MFQKPAAPIYLFRFAFLVVFTLAVFNPAATAQRGKLKKEIARLMDQFGAAGLSVAAVKDGKLIYSQAFGYQDIEKNEKLGVKDIFRIASISKSFSATAIQQLAEAGKLSLNDDVSGLIGFTVRNPAFPDKPITLRMLLSHTSSINDSQGYFTLDSINPARTANWARCYSNYGPGEQYRYCNLNFNMIGAIIEKLSGERFDQYIYHHILQPLQLYGGYCVDSLDASRFVTLYEFDTALKSLVPSPNAYHPRREELAKYVLGYSAPIFSPTGGMKISAVDLARYMIMHMNLGTSKGVRIISEASATEMQTPVLESAQYGLALMTTSTFIEGKTLIGHTGSAYGLNSVMFFSPVEKFGLVLICSGSNSGYKNGFHEFLQLASQVVYDRLKLGN